MKSVKSLEDNLPAIKFAIDEAASLAENALKEMSKTFFTNYPDAKCIIIQNLQSEPSHIETSLRINSNKKYNDFLDDIVITNKPYTAYDLCDIICYASDYSNIQNYHKSMVNEYKKISKLIVNNSKLFKHLIPADKALILSNNNIIYKKENY